MLTSHIQCSYEELYVPSLTFSWKSVRNRIKTYDQPFVYVAIALGLLLRFAVLDPLFYAKELTSSG